MGLFDNIKKKVGDATEAYKESYDKAMQMDIMELHEAMKEVKMIELGGYKAAFREKCEPLNSNELIKLHSQLNKLRDTFSLKGNPSTKVIEDILVERGVWSRNEDGTIQF